MRSRVRHKEPNDLTPSSFFDKERNSNFFEKNNNPFFQPAVQPKLKVNQPGDVYEQEADTMAGKVMNRLSGPVAGGDATHPSQTASKNSLSVQRKCSECEKEQDLQGKKEISVQRQVADNFSSGDGSAGAEAAESLSGPSPAKGDQSADATTGSGMLIVDDIVNPSASQMRKSEFLALLKQEVYAAAAEVLGGTPLAAGASIYIEPAFARYAGNTAAQLEQMITQEVPGAMQSPNAMLLIQAIRAKVAAEIKSKVPGLGMMSDVAQTVGDVAQTVGGAVGDAANAVGDTLSNVGSAIGDAASGLGDLLFKGNNGGAHATQSPVSVMQNLGSGQSLESSSQNKMEAAFGTSFSNVEMHTDANAAQLSGDMNARAFTVGNHIAFGNGQYQPGSLVGDALLAHELAHVIQQRGSVQKDNKESAYNNLENDADHSAIAAIIKQYGESGTVETRKPKGKAGLSIQRCGPSSPKGAGGKDAGPTPAPGDAGTPVVAKPTHPTGPMKKPSELGTEVAGATRTKWRVSFKTTKEAKDKVDLIRKKGIKADDPEQEGKNWIFFYYPLTEAEAKAAQAAKQKELGDKYKVDIKNDETIMKSWYLEISLKCPEAIPVKAGYEVWEAGCYTAEKDAKVKVKEFSDAKVPAEVYMLDESMYGIYFKPFNTEAEAVAAGEAESKKRGGFAEGMFKTTAVKNESLKSFVYTTTTSCPAGYTDKGIFEITTYVLPKEDDFSGPLVKPCGLSTKHKKDFLFGSGTKMQGSGMTSAGKYIAYDGNDCFKEVSKPLSASGKELVVGKTIAVDTKVISHGKQVLIEDVGLRTAEDTGGAIKGKHIDVYYGTTMTLKEAWGNPINGNHKVCQKD